MFGDQLLVAPVTTQGATTRDVYIPAGQWYDFWNTGRFIGASTKIYGVPCDLIPVYARPGAIIPPNLNADYQLGDNISNSMSHINLTFRIYPESSSSYSYYDDAAGTTRTFQSTENWGLHQVTVSVPVMPVASTLQIIATRPGPVTRNELIARVHASLTASSFTLYEDDGETSDYQSGAVRTMLISQQLSGSTAE